MKPSHPFTIALACQLAISACHAGGADGNPAAQPGDAAVIRSATDEEIARARTKPLFAAHATVGRSAPVAPAFVETSDFIAFDGCCTFVPKGAILHVPDRLGSSIVGAPSGELVLWQRFLASNRARVASLEVTLDEASGARPIDAKKLGLAVAGGRIVVAVMHGHPVSVVAK